MGLTAVDKYLADNPGDYKVRVGKSLPFKCPSMYGYLEDPTWCNTDGTMCFQCWYRDIPEEEKEKDMTANKVDFKCCNCAHFTVCSLKEEFMNAQAAVDQVLVPRDHDENCIHLHDIKWIKPVKLDCIHFMDVPVNTRTNYDLNQWLTQSDSTTNATKRDFATDDINYGSEGMR